MNGISYDKEKLLCLVMGGLTVTGTLVQTTIQLLSKEKKKEKQKRRKIKRERERTVETVQEVEVLLVREAGVEVVVPADETDEIDEETCIQE